MLTDFAFDPDQKAQECLIANLGFFLSELQVSLNKNSAI